MVQVNTLETPVGPLWLAHDDDGHLRRAVFSPEHDQRPMAVELHRQGAGSARRSKLARASVAAFERYFEGDLEALTVGVLPPGTPFQQAVWQALLAIAPGTTRTYADLAAAIGKPRAVRAVGLANRNNPLSIVIPCHRLVGRDGTMRGYAGGVDAKRWLLAHEGATADGRR